MQQNHQSSEATNMEQQLKTQEEMDAQLARLMAETGKSLRGLEEEGITAQLAQMMQTNVESPLSLPPQQEQNAPAVARRPETTSTQNAPSQPNKNDTDSSHGMPERPQFDFDDNSEHRGASRPASRFRTPKKLADFIAGLGKKPNSPFIPAPFPEPSAASRRIPGPFPHSESFTRNPSGLVDRGAQQRRGASNSLCAVCRKPTANSYLLALDKKYHLECFSCSGCHVLIDSDGPFAFMEDDSGEKQPLHTECYAELYGVKCCVCKESIHSGPDGRIAYVKHPFFDKEIMCPKHATKPGRRCTGCHRFEPENEPFADLNDGGRCVCYSCCRTVVVDNADAEHLWRRVLEFFEQRLELPLWPEMRNVPVLLVGYEALNEQMAHAGGTHGGSSQIMTRGLCLTEHQSGRRLKLSKMKFDPTTSSFRALDAEEKGFTFYFVPEANKANPHASVTCILCLSGLPSDLAASILAHEATHAWIKLHPQYDFRNPIPPQVEEGAAQLVAMLFLNDGLEPASSATCGDSGPTDERLRQYFKFSIETDDNRIYGDGYRKAARAYADIGLEPLLSHIVMYKEFPMT